MGVIDVMMIVKKIHAEDVILVKAGTFYNVYERDAIIIGYLLGYKIKEVDGHSTTGFPTSSLYKVITRLEEEHINYIVLDKAHNYEEESMNFKKENRYNEVYEKARKHINMNNRINHIYEYLLQNIENNEIKTKIQQMEDIIYEKR